MDELKLTVKQRKFLKYYLESGNASEAALKAGYRHRQRGQELVSNSVVQQAYQALLDKQGLSDGKLNDILDKLLKSDNDNIQLGALKLGFQLKGRLSQKVEHSGEVKTTPPQVQIVHYIHKGKENNGEKLNTDTGSRLSRETAPLGA